MIKVEASKSAQLSGIPKKTHCAIEIDANDVKEINVKSNFFMKKEANVIALKAIIKTALISL
ncbi:MAG: hypothetical protein ACJASQ_004283 [Crocinitomicaceae bacterium]|jgi:hypothetical protein